MKPLLLCVLLAACGRVGFRELATGDAPGDGSGSATTRLRQTYTVYDGTLRQPSQQLYDSQLAAPCYPEPTTAAGLRCLPNSSGVYYLDAACTQAVAPAGSGSGFAFDLGVLPVAHAYTFGASVGTVATAYVMQYDGSCAATSPDVEMFALTEVSFDLFAPLTPHLGSEGRIVSQELVSDDGFHTPWMLHDTQVDADCVGSTYDDASVCFVVPTDVAYYYLDSGCTQVAEDAYTSVRFAEHWSTPQVCKAADLEIRPLTTELPSTTSVWLEIPGSGSCVATAVGAGRRLFALGAPISLAPVTRQPVPGGRMQAIETTANGARAEDPYGVWDSTLGFECKPTVAYDGTTRCLPADGVYASAGGYWTDAGCTQPITGAGVQAPECTSTTVEYVFETPSGAPGPRVFHAVRRSGPIYGGGPTSCTPYQNRDFYIEGAEVPIDMFAAVTQQTAP